MSGDNCLVCASNEGVFVNVEEQPEIKDKAKNCRLDKVWDESETNKVCHKCAFEIDQCNVFIEKVKKASQVQNAEKNSCVLCSDTQDNNNYLFDLSKQKNGVNGLIQRLQDQFSDELKNRELNKEFICLSCRYCIDLLADLKTILNEVPSKLKSVVKNGIDPADLPKTKTIIASRKTTYIQSSHLHLYTPSDTESDTSTIMGSKKKANKTSKSLEASQKCGQCKTGLPIDVDTYRLFKTGKTICKQCWLITDFNKSTSKKRKKVNYPSTPLCSVLIKDLYHESNDSKYTVTEDQRGNVVFKATDDEEEQTEKKTQKSKTRQRKNSEESVDNKEPEPTKTTRQRKESEQSEHEEQNETSISRQRKDSEHSETVEDIPAKLSKDTRHSKDSVQDEEEGSVKSSRTTRHRKDSEQSVQESIDIKSSRATRQQKGSEQSVQDVETRPARSSRRRKDSEQSVQEDIEAKPTRSRTRKTSEQSVQSVEVKISSRSTRRKDSERSEPEEIQIDIDVDSDEGPATKRAKKSSANTESATKAKVQNQTSANASKRKRGSRSSSVESTDSLRKSARNAKKHSQALEEIIEIDDDVSDTDKVEKELTRPKRSRTARAPSNDEGSAAELDKVELNKSSPKSSKEPTPEPQTALPSKNETEDSTNVVAEVQTNTSQINDFHSSESEEIDILKSTDEESKNDESIENRRHSKSVSDVEIESEQEVSHKTIEQLDDSASKLAEYSQPNVEINEDAQSDARETSVDREEPEAAEEPTKEKSVEKDIEETEKDDDDASISKNKSDEEEQDMSDDGKENKAFLNKRSSKKNARKSKTTGGKKSRKSKVKLTDEITADVSDSEQIEAVRVPIMNSYTCTVCEEIFVTKYEGLQHEITHAKCLKVSLEKVNIPERRKSNDSDKIDEPMDVDEDAEVANEAVSDEDMETANETDVLKNHQETENIEMPVVNDKEPLNTIDDLDRIDTVNEDEEQESDKAPEQNDSETEMTPSKRGRRASRRQSSRVAEDKREKKSRGRRKITNDISEPEVTTAIIEAEPEKFAEVVEETLNDVAESDERIQEESVSKEQEEEDVTIENQEKESENQENENEDENQEKENENLEDKEPEIFSNDEPEVETIVESESDTEIPATQNPEEREHEIETHDIADDSSREEVIFDSNPESRDAEPEDQEHPIVNLDDEISGDAVDVDSEAKKHSDESEVEITEVDDVDPNIETVEPDEIVECEQVDLTGKDETEDAPKADEEDDDNEIEEIEQEPSGNINEDENTIDSVTEINVRSEGEPTIENNAENPRPNDDTDNTTEDEALAQESLEDLLERKGLQVVDEFAEPVTDNDDESEKDVNVSSEKENSPRKNDQTANDIEIRISDGECAEITELSNISKSPNKKSVDGEVQITQDVDVVEEVVNDDDDVQPQNDVVEEVEVESNNVSFNFPKLY